jgi:hypothetical protein
MSAARHAYGPTVAVANERPQKTDVPLTSFGIALRTTFGIALSAVATWFVLLPAIHEKPPTLQTCEVVLLANGTTRCDNGEMLANVVNRQP